MKKRIVSMMLCFCMVISLLPGITVPAAAAITPTQPTVGDGTEGNPYQIKTVEELAWCIKWTGVTQHSVLKANLSIPADWPRSYAGAFTGTFDGGGHTITNQAMTSPIHLFDEVRGVVRNLHVNVGYTADQGVDISGICGEVQSGGLVENCFVSGNFTYNCNSPGVTIGGICANLKRGGTVRSCCSTIKLKHNYTNDPTYMGTLIGSAGWGGIIENCFALDEAFNYTIGKNSTYAGSETVTKVTAEELKNGATTYLLNGSKSTDVAWYQTLNGSSLPSLDKTQKTVYATTKRDCPDSPLKAISYNNTAENELPSGSHDYSTPTGLCKYCNHRSPNAAPAGDGTEETPYLINSMQELYWFWDAASRENAAFCAKLTADITVNQGAVTKDMTDPITWTPIGTSAAPYTGIFDGDGHKISGLYCTGTDMAGLFGVSSGTIKGLAVENSYFYAKNISSVCVQNNESGKLENCVNKCAVALVEGNGTDSFKAGGVCAINNGMVSGCSNDGAVSATLEITNSIPKDRYFQLGGVCAYSNGSVTESTNNGAVNVHCNYTVSTGLYKMLFHAGGICGENQGTLQQSANKGAVDTEINVVNGGIGCYTGGICGNNGVDGKISTSYNSHALQYTTTGSLIQSRLAGITGSNLGLVEKCFNTEAGTLTGAVAYHESGIMMGGIAGCNDKNGCLKSSYSMAAVSQTGGKNSYANSICGLTDDKTVIERCFGLTGTATKTHNVYNFPTMIDCAFKTTEQFKSGEVTYLLNGITGGDIWYQNIDSGTIDAVPVLDSTHAKVYYYSGNYSNGDCPHTNADPITGLCPDCNTYSGKPEQGDGTAQNPYQLSNSKNLYWFSALIFGQEGMPANPAAHAVLTNDITVNAGTISESSSGVTAWNTIGTIDKPFAGSIDGQGHTVSGLYLNEGSKRFVGFVGRISPDVSIKNLTIANSYFNGDYCVGAVCGGSEIDNFKGDGELSNCHTLSDVKVSGAYYVGGMIGHNKLTISGCTNKAQVSASSCAGGIAGVSVCVSITNCENQGEIIGGSSFQALPLWGPQNNSLKGAFFGGIVGAFTGITSGSTATISNSFNKGTVSSNSSYGSVGGIAGGISLMTEVKNCYNTAEINAPNANGITEADVFNSNVGGVGGVVGTNYGNTGHGTGTVIQCHNVGRITGKNIVGGVIGNGRFGANVKNCFSLEGMANDVVGESGSSCVLENVSIKTAEELQNGSLIEALNTDGAVWEQGVNHPIFLRTELAVSGVSLSGKIYDGTPLSYSGTPTATLNGVAKTVAGFTHTWQSKEADGKYKNLPDNLAPKNAGSYRLAVSVSASEPEYRGCQNLDVTISPITVSSPTITVEGSNYPYTGTPIEPAVTVKDGESVIPADQYTVSYENNIAVGTAKINISPVEGANYKVSGSITFSITKAGGSTAPLFSAWDNVKNTFTFISTSGTTYQWRINDGAWTDIVASSETTSIPVGNVIVPAGKLEVRVKATATHDEGVSLTNTSEQVFTATLEGSVTINYTAPSCGDTLTAEVSGQQSDAVLHYQWKAGDANVGTDASTYVVQSSDIGKTITVLVTAKPYEGSLTSAATISVTAGIPDAHDASIFTRYIDTSTQTVSAERFGIKMAGMFTGNGDKTDSGNILQSVAYGESVTFKLNSGLSLTNQTASIPLLFTPADSNYVPKALTLTITLTNKEPIEITGLSPAANLSYNGSSQSGYTGAVTVLGNKVPASELLYTYTGTNGTSYSSTTAPTDAGSYTLLVSIPSNNANYVGDSGTIPFTIAKKPVTVKADNKSMTRGGARPSFTVTYTGFVGTENEQNAALATPAAASCSADGSTAGAFAISITTQAVLNNTIGRNYTITSQSAGTLTVQAPSSGGNSSGGGGGGGTTDTGTKITCPVSSEEGSIKSEATVKDGTANITIFDKQIQEIVSDKTEIGMVKIDVSGLKVDAVVIPSKLVSAVDNASGSAGLEAVLSNGTVILDKTALNAIKDKGDVKISVETVDHAKLSDTQKAVLGKQENTAVVVDVNVYVNGTKTSTFHNGKIHVSVPYTLKSGENADSITVWFIKDDGTIEPKSGTYSNGKVEFTTDHLSQYLIVSFPFVDVDPNTWCYGSVAYAYNNGLFSGTSAITFSPDTAMTRQMIWMVLARMDGRMPADMDEARHWAMENGISDGSNPSNSINREQLAAILYRYAAYKKYDTTQGGMTIREFEDYDSISGYAQTPLSWAVNVRLIKGSNNKLMPRGDATRAQVAAILMRLIQHTKE